MNHDCHEDPTETATYGWLRIAKLLLGILVSVLTVLRLLGALPHG